MELIQKNTAPVNDCSSRKEGVGHAGTYRSSKLSSSFVLPSRSRSCAIVPFRCSCSRASWLCRFRSSSFAWKQEEIDQQDMIDVFQAVDSAASLWSHFRCSSNASWLCRSFFGGLKRKQREVNDLISCLRLQSKRRVVLVAAVMASAVLFAWAIERPNRGTRGNQRPGSANEGLVIWSTEKWEKHAPQTLSLEG